MISEWVVLWRLVLAAFLSGVVGFEREFHGRAAGFRTHILVCLGATLVMLTSIHVFEVYYLKAPCDPARIAAGVITGIGFLGAGAIMRSKVSVRGLTTAASLWVVTGIGLAIGSGMYFAAIVTTILALIALFFFSRLEHTLIRKDWYKTMAIEAQDGVDRIKNIRQMLDEYGVDITDFEAGRSLDGLNMLLKISLKLYTSQYDDQILKDISGLDGVKSVKWVVR